MRVQSRAPSSARLSAQRIWSRRETTRQVSRVQLFGSRAGAGLPSSSQLRRRRRRILFARKRDKFCCWNLLAAPAPATRLAARRQKAELAPRDDNYDDSSAGDGF